MSSGAKETPYEKRLSFWIVSLSAGSTSLYNKQIKLVTPKYYLAMIRYKINF